MSSSPTGIAASIIDASTSPELLRENIKNLCQSKDAEIERLRDGYGALLKEYTAERDQLYDCVTNSEGGYSTEDDKRCVDEMDAIIDAALALLTASVSGAGEGDDARTDH